MSARCVSGFDVQCRFFQAKDRWWLVAVRDDDICNRVFQFQHFVEEFNKYVFVCFVAKDLFEGNVCFGVYEFHGLGVVGSYFLIGIIPNLAILCHATPSVWVLGGTQAGHNCCIRWILAAKQPKRPSVVGGKHQKCHRATLTVLALLSVDDCFTGSLSSSAAAVNEGSTVTYTATLNKVSATDLNIPYTLGGTATLTADYTGSVATTGNIKIVAGALTGTLVLTAVNDAKTEGAETVSVTLGATAGVLAGATTVTTTITDTSLTPIVPTVAVARAIPVKATDANTVATAVDANGAVANLNDNVAFNISAGTFGYAIKNFAAGDKLNFFANAIVNVLPDANNTDGIQVWTAQDAATGTTTTVTLTGLTAEQDLGVFNEPSFATIFGAGSMTVDGLFTAATTPAVAPVKATPVTVSATTATAPFVATANSDTFTIASGTYAATIDKFAATDVLKFFTGAVINVLPDIDNADGKQVLTAQDATTGTTATITLTGLTAAQDAGLFNQPSFATVFGAGTIA